MEKFVNTTVKTSKNRNIEITFLIERKTLTQISTSDMLDEDEVILEINIPNSLKGNDIKYIGNSIFSANVGVRIAHISAAEKIIGRVKKVVIEDGIEEISGGAFKYSNIEELVWPKNITTIPKYCFEYSFIKNVTFTGDVSIICIGAFFGCKYLQSIDLPDSVYSVAPRAFSQSGLKSIRWPDNCNIIPEACFQECLAFKEITNIENVVKIGDFAFDKSSLTSVPKLEKCKTIGKMAFSDTNIHSFYWPSNINIIPALIFYNCMHLKSIENIDHITNVQSSAFEHSGLESFFWPKNCSVIPQRCFFECKRLKKFTIEDGQYEIGTAAFSGDDLLNADFSRCILCMQGDMEETFGYEKNLKFIKFPYFMS